MEKVIFFPYSWHVNENEQNTQIRIFGLTQKNKSICVTVNNFTPYIYIELPEKINWTSVKAVMVGNKIDSLCGKRTRRDGTIYHGTSPIKKSLVYKEKLYYANLDNKSYKKFPFLLLTFASSADARKFRWKIKKPVYISGIGSIKLKSHEHNVNPIIQLTSLQNISTADWIQFQGKKSREKESYCKYEYVAKWNHLKHYNSDIVPKPLVLSYDIEVNSTVPSAMPNADRPGDKVFQISCVLFKNNSKKFENYLLTLGEPDPDTVGDDVEILMYGTEANLLIGFTEFIREKNPQVIVGYNILGFDCPYMIARAKWQRVIYEFDQQSCIKYHHAPETLIKWSSSAYKNQSFEFLDAHGRLFVDLLPIIKRDYKLNKYSLKVVSEHFIGDTKDPLSVKGIFKCYKTAFGKNGRWNGTEKGAKSLGIVGKYCVQDSVLVGKLFNMLQTWVGLTEMAKTCNVPIFYLYTKGQQIKVFSQVYKKCLKDDTVVEYDAYEVKDNERYTGAYVFNPIPGLYDKVVPFDFSSLYPTTIIAYNIDYKTLGKR